MMRMMPVLILALCLECQSALQATTSTQNEAKAADQSVVNAKDFGVVGDGVQNDTKGLQDAINAAAGKILYIPRPSVMYKTDPLFLVSNMRVVFAPGTIIEANKGYQTAQWLPGKKTVSYDCLLTIDNLENVFIEGNGSTLRMPKAEYTEGEHRFCISIGSSRNVTITDLTVRDSGGDGIMVRGADRLGLYDIPCQNIYLRGIKSVNNRRQGMSVLSVEGLLVENCEFRDTKGTSPEAGIDIEIEYNTCRAHRVVIRNCLFSGNNQHGIIIQCAGQFVDVVTGNKVNVVDSVVDITIENCRFIGPNDQFEMWGVDKDVNGPDTGYVRGRVTVRDCYAKNCNGPGFAKFGSQVPLYIERCIADHCGLYTEKNEQHNRSRAGFGIYGANTFLTDCRTQDYALDKVAVPDNRWDVGISGEYWEPFGPIQNVVIRDFRVDSTMQRGDGPRIMVWDQKHKSETDIDEIQSLIITYSIPPVINLSESVHNLSYGEAGKVITNRKAKEKMSVKLPRAVAIGASFTFRVDGDKPLAIIPFEGDRIAGCSADGRPAEAGGFRGGYKSMLTIRCERSGLWAVSSCTGKWSFN